ncbi:M3 family oligoendopeptidase [Halovenus rubra]|nr:M3 family metallopeptidase [Halovenus rubra]
MSLPARTDIDPEYRFDLTAIYASPTEWEDAYEQLCSRLSELQSLVVDPVSAAAELETLLDAVADCFRRKQRIELYATLAANVATDSDDAADRKRRSERLTETFEPAVTAALRRIGEAKEYIDDLPESDRRYARNLRAQARHVRSADVEEAIAAFEEPLGASSRIVRAARLEDFEPPVVERPDGKSVEVRYGNRRTELSHPDREYRRRVFEAYHGRMDRYEHTLTRAFGEKLQAAHAEASVRGYDSIRQRALNQRCYPESGLRASLPEKVHDAMLEAVRGNLDPFHDALSLRKRRLGVDRLRPWDLQVSIAESDPPELDFESARDHILAALEPLGEDYVERAKQFFTQRRIDVYPTQDKRTDIPAYCPSSAKDGAYILANFEGDLRTAFFICHELGHAMHVEYEREGATRYANAPRPVEEVPSILHELLLVDHLLDEGGALADGAQNRLLECIGGNFYGAARSAAFTHALAQHVEDGEEITVDRARDIAASLREEFYAPVEFGDHPGRRLPVSGIREAYSNYQYVLGAMGALSVHSQLRNGDFTPESYRDFLRSTGRQESVVLFETLGCDVWTAEPFEMAAGTFGEYVSAFDEEKEN